jgi:predicted esterase
MHARRGKELNSGFQFLELCPLGDGQSNAAIVYLHGIGERGEDLTLVTRYGLPAAISEGRALANCPIFCPQLEDGAEWEAGRVASFVRQVRGRHSSVALIGYSLGASGVCSVVAHIGPAASAFIAIAGQAPDRVGTNQEGVQFLAIQGELDTWPDTGRFVPSINERGGRAASVVLPGLGHYVSEEAVAHPACTSMLGAIGIEVIFRKNAG